MSIDYLELLFLTTKHFQVKQTVYYADFKSSLRQIN